MPELPEVETTLRGLALHLEGRRIAHVAVNRADLRRPFPQGLAQHLTGATITSLTRRAKYGLLHTDRDTTMVFHLGMSGRWRIDPQAFNKHDHLVLTTDPTAHAPSHILALNDARRFGSVDLIATAGLDQWPAFAALGPEPLGPGLTAAHLASALAGRAAPIKPLLLDQRIVAGLGNIYVCEALHRARLDPDRAAGTIPRAALQRLVAAIRDVLSEAIAAGGSTIRDYAQPNGELGYFAARWRVYGREGEPCLAATAKGRGKGADKGAGTCPGTIIRTLHAGRSTFACDTCQI